MEYRETLHSFALSKIYIIIQINFKFCLLGDVKIRVL